MRFLKVTLQGFRNLPLAEVELTGRRTFLCGANAQGKTNFLEALGYVTALRSFRGAEARALIGLGQSQTGMAFSLEHERFGASQVTITLTSDGKRWALLLADDGVGLEATKQHRAMSHGLLGMRERIVALGGSFDVRGSAGCGTTLTAKFPVVEREEVAV